MTNVELLHDALGEREIPSLNGLRAIAVSSVMLYHAGYWWFPGGQGVTLFFVVSGFLITWLLLKEDRSTGSVSLRKFYIRRSLRIFPAFYAYWLLVLGLLVLSQRTIHWGHIWASFFYFGNYWIAASLPQNASLSHTWSLAIEEQFYLFLPGLFLLMRSNGRRLSYALAAVIALVWMNRIVRVLGDGSETYLYHATDTRIDHLLIGCLIAVVVDRGLPAWCGRLLTTPIYLMTMAVLVLSMIASYQSPLQYRMTVGFALEPLLLGVIVLQSIAIRPRLLQWQPVAYIGRISYGLYLYQQITIPAAQKLMPGDMGLLDFAAGAVLTLVAAEVSYRVVERRFLILKDHWSVQAYAATTGVGDRRG